jgi:hypothetical protein
MSQLLPQADLIRTQPPQATSQTGGQVAARESAGGGFRALVQQASTTNTPAAEVVVQRGDTLVGLVRQWHRERGADVSDAQAYRQALQVARTQGIDNPNLIVPGQRVRLDGLVIHESTAVATSAPKATRVAMQPTAATLLQQRVRSAPLGQHAVLDKTLQRAQDKGYIPTHEVGAVRQRVMQMAQTFGFAPDDFARVAMMESDGFNPEANNGRCFGVIQFCSGRGQGADSVGMAERPRDILGMSVLEQLDLVETYFRDTGLDRMGPRVGLVDLYLTVLTPAAREVRGLNTPLNIAGEQANMLYEGGRRGNAMTRNSILQGLHALTNQRLGLTEQQAQRQLSPAQRQQFAAAVSSATEQ